AALMSLAGAQKRKQCEGGGRIVRSQCSCAAATAVLAGPGVAVKAPSAIGILMPAEPVERGAHGALAGLGAAIAADHLLPHAFAASFKPRAFAAGSEFVVQPRGGHSDGPLNINHPGAGAFGHDAGQRADSAVVGREQATPRFFERIVRRTVDL